MTEEYERRKVFPVEREREYEHDYERPFDRKGQTLGHDDEVRFTGPPDVTDEQIIKRFNQYRVSVKHPVGAIGKVRVDDGKAASAGHIWVSFDGGAWVRMPSSHIEKIQ
jgi:hypothetical protein